MLQVVTGLAIWKPVQFSGLSRDLIGSSLSRKRPVTTP